MFTKWRIIPHLTSGVQRTDFIHFYSFNISCVLCSMSHHALQCGTGFVLHYQNMTTSIFTRGHRRRFSVACLRIFRLPVNIYIYSYRLYSFSVNQQFLLPCLVQFTHIHSHIIQTNKKIIHEKLHVRFYFSKFYQNYRRTLVLEYCS